MFESLEVLRRFLYVHMGGGGGSSCIIILDLTFEYMYSIVFNITIGTNMFKTYFPPKTKCITQLNEEANRIAQGCSTYISLYVSAFFLIGHTFI